MTTPIRTWSPTAASNSQTPPFGAPEGGLNINQISDTFRQLMASVRQWYEGSGWIDLGHTPTYVSGTVFTVTGNQSATYEVGRRVRAINSTLTTIYGTISAVAYLTSTSVTVTWDSGSLDSTVAEVAVGAADTTSPWISFRALAGTILRTQLPSEAIFQTGMVMPYFSTTAPTGWVLWFGSIGSATSGASNRANADTSALYSMVWNSFANTEAAVTGGRGDNAAADFAANKAIALPDGRGCVLAMMDNLGGGTAAGRITSAISGLDGTKIGSRGGDQRMHQHGHTITDPGHAHGSTQLARPGSTFTGGGAQIGPGSTEIATTGITVNSSGAGASQNVQPTIMMPYIIKL